MNAVNKPLKINKTNQKKVYTALDVYKQVLEEGERKVAKAKGKPLNKIEHEHMRLLYSKLSLKMLKEMGLV